MYEKSGKWIKEKTFNVWEQIVGFSWVLWLFHVFFMEDWSDFFFFFLGGGGGGSCGPMKNSAQVLSTTENGGPMTTFNDLSNIKFHRSFWLMFFFSFLSWWGRLRVGACSTTGTKNIMKTVVLRTPDSTCNTFWVRVPDFSLETIDSIGIPMPGAQCDWHVCLQNKSSRQIPESGVWGHLPTVGLSKTVYHCVMKTTKQQLTYKLFQHIVIP